MKVKISDIKKPRIEMLPLIDIVFLLLVVFIYSMLSMSIHYGMPVLLPLSSVAMPEKHLVLSVTVKGENEVFLDDQEVSMEDLTRMLTQKIVGAENPGVLLFAQKNISYQVLFRVLDQIKLAGISKISLQAEIER